MARTFFGVCVCFVLFVGCGVLSGRHDATTGQSATTPVADDGYTSPPDPSAAPSPKWIWGPAEAKPDEEQYFRVVFDPGLPAQLKTENPSSAWIWAACDDEMTIFLNGKTIVKGAGWTTATLADVRSDLVSGDNVLAVKCKNAQGPAGLSLKLEIRRQDREPFRLVTDGSWKTLPTPVKGWRSAKFENASMTPARVVGDFGMEPWGKIAVAVPTQATAVENLTLLPGFKAELLYSVPKGSQGSWVSMTPDPKGRLYVSDQGGSLYRVTPAKGEKPTQVEKVNLEIGSAQGLLWAFDSLYVVVNSKGSKRESGLYRLRDTGWDDKLDQITLLKSFKDRSGKEAGYGEHGPHAVVLGPDKMLYVVAGNFTSLPEPVARTSPARHWAEDLLLPRMADGKGHDPTIMAPASCVSRTDKDGKKWEAVSVGMRNAYDMAFNPDGELFTFDSDMEWDMGAPWYRPIRICHVVPGAEWGWRNGSGKWPVYYPDSLPPVVDIGAGSPTGVTFGTGAKFPEKYQRAFFASDWAYGKLYAVHLEPKGASYSGTFEPFVTGKPFDITDCVINTDGAMYITIGGRGTQSGLYRITYVGEESTAAVKPVQDKASAEARALRHKLEKYQTRQDAGAGAVSFAWTYLNSEDRFIRYAARVAIENQDVKLWQERALAENPPTASINALVALCRVGDKSLQPRILESLNRLDLATLTEEQRLEALRVYGLCFVRMGEPGEAMASTLRAKFEPMFPAKSADVTHELCQILIYLKSPTVVAKSMKLLEAGDTQEEQMFYAFHLRNTKDGWTPETREMYFKWLNKAQQNYTGGASFQLFLKNVREDAIKTLDEGEKVALSPILKPMLEAATLGPQITGPSRKFVKNWKMADLAAKLDQTKSGRSFENGKAAFAAVSCIKCHRFKGEGGASGPDITGVGARFQAADVLESILLPSKVISDQYQSTEIITNKKKVYVGTVQSEDDKQVVLRSSPLSTETEKVLKKDIAVRRPSKLSVMPEGLLDVLSETEVLDLLAYVRSAGDPKDKAFAGGQARGKGQDARGDAGK
jgi:putative heme-binding domain-containing protein